MSVYVCLPQAASIHRAGAQRQAAYRARRLGKRGDGVAVNLIVSIHAAAILKQLCCRHAVAEAVALADALNVAETALLRDMNCAERVEYLKAVRVAGVSILP